MNCRDRAALVAVLFALNPVEATAALQLQDIQWAADHVLVLSPLDGKGHGSFQVQQFNNPRLFKKRHEFCDWFAGPLKL